MYKTNSQVDGYSALEFFLTKLNPECDALFQYPKRNWRTSDQVWYENRPLCVNKLSTTMKEISKKAGLSRIYTNHSVRATAITLWANAGLSDRDIMAISGHRSEASLRSYHQQPSVNQLRKCSDVLTVAPSPRMKESMHLQVCNIQLQDIHFYHARVPLSTASRRIFRLHRRRPHTATCSTRAQSAV